MIVADEPVSALDVSVQEQVLELIKDIQHKLGLAMLFITHDLRVAAQVCDRVLSCIAAASSKAAERPRCSRNPQHDYTRQLLAAIPGSSRFKN